MNAGDQRDRQQFHEAEKLDAVQAAIFTARIAAALLHPLVENIEIGAGGKMPKPAANDNRPATGLLRLFDLFNDGIDELRSQQIVGPINHGQHGDIAALLARNQCILRLPAAIDFDATGAPVRSFLSEDTPKLEFAS